MSKIILGRDESAKPLTIDIADEKRQALAYNMLYYMMEHGASLTVKGKEVRLNKDDLYVFTDIDGKKHYEKPHLDAEWYGANGQNFKKENELYTIGNLSNDYVLVMYAPMTVDYKKANAMNNCMLTAIDSSVSISCAQDNKMYPVIVNGRPTNPAVVTENGQLCTEHFDRDWPKKEASEIEYHLAVPKKYELLMDDIKKVWGGSYMEYFKSETSLGWDEKNRNAYRIRALCDFGDVKAGDLGGYIESENNLSHTGNCWVYDNAVVCCDAVVKDNATVRDDAEIKQAVVISGNANVFGEARLENNAHISDYAQVGWEWDGIQNENGYRNANATVIRDNAEVSGHAQVLGEVVVTNNAKIRDNAKVEGKWPVIQNKFAYYIGCIGDNAIIEGNAKVINAYVESNARVCENAYVSGHSKLGGHATIKGNALIGGNAQITHNVEINGHAKIGGTAEITNKINIGHDANIQETDDYFSLTDIGKTSYAVHNQDDGITVVHKGKTYNGIEAFKQQMGDSLGDKGHKAIEAMENHFELQLMKGFKEGLESLNVTDEQPRL